MKAKHLIYALFMLIGSAAAAQTTMPAAEKVLNNAYAQASKENKKVILMFHASWCGWCKKMDASLVDPVCKKMFDDNYVIAHLDVMEQPVKAHLENPGAMAVMTKYGGEKSGLPFWLVLDTKGNMLANSLMPKDGATTATAEEM
jgi:thioredoxin-related protein